MHWNKNTFYITGKTSEQSDTKVRSRTRRLVITPFTCMMLRRREKGVVIFLSHVVRFSRKIDLMLNQRFVTQWKMPYLGYNKRNTKSQSF